MLNYKTNIILLLILFFVFSKTIKNFIKPWNPHCNSRSYTKIFGNSSTCNDAKPKKNFYKGFGLIIRSVDYEIGNKVLKNKKKMQRVKCHINISP